MFQSPSLRGSGLFQALVERLRNIVEKVSIPFIAGQWSLRKPKRALVPKSAFQSPSLRGSGLFGAGKEEKMESLCFNPLHCGAVVSSKRARAPPKGAPRVSIPFIAGQWSLQTPLAARRGRARRESFNPLHCGAVVSSKAVKDRAVLEPCFNPLHCGAVVSSFGGARNRICPIRFNPLHCGAVVSSWTRIGPGASSNSLVSIPFIAGQWSLPSCSARTSPRSSAFQSPSLRGSGLFIRPLAVSYYIH